MSNLNTHFNASPEARRPTDPLSTLPQTKTTGVESEEREKTESIAQEHFTEATHSTPTTEAPLSVEVTNLTPQESQDHAMMTIFREVDSDLKAEGTSLFDFNSFMNLAKVHENELPQHEQEHIWNSSLLSLTQDEEMRKNIAALTSTDAKRVSQELHFLNVPLNTPPVDLATLCVQKGCLALFKLLFDSSTNPGMFAIHVIFKLLPSHVDKEIKNIISTNLAKISGFNSFL